MKKTITALLVAVVPVSLIHFVLLRAMQHWNIASAILSPGSQVPLWKMIVASSFLLSRLLLILIAPACCIAIAGLAIWNRDR